MEEAILDHGFAAAVAPGAPHRAERPVGGRRDLDLLGLDVELLPRFARATISVCRQLTHREALRAEAP
jgi:hypothetical protein